MDSSIGSHGTLRVHLEWGEEVYTEVSNWEQVCLIEWSGVAAFEDTHESHPSFNISAQVCSPEDNMCGAAQDGCLILGDTAIPVTMSSAESPTPWQKTCPVTLLEQLGPAV